MACSRGNFNYTPILQSDLASYECGEKATEVELLKERVQLLEEEVRVQQEKMQKAEQQGEWL